ncbi:MAG: citryl-CoA lyase [Candidatus Doudnabacteria bacterium]|nr:citryl-CoA lyase [Candidatus Doudnabacteria bacterium]
MAEVWRSGITNDGPDSNGGQVRGVQMTELMEKYSFADALLLTVFGDSFSTGQKRVIEAFLSGMVDHGIGTSSARAARLVASTGADHSAALAAGLLAAGGPRHGGAVGKAAAYFEALDKDATSAEEIVARAIETKERIPGFGHAVMKDGDPRATMLQQIAEQEGVSGATLAFATAMEAEFEARKGKKLPLNVDGTFAALLVDFGIPAEKAGVFFLIARTPGLIAHILEEHEREGKLRRLEYDEYSFE